MSNQANAPAANDKAPGGSSVGVIVVENTAAFDCRFWIAGKNLDGSSYASKNSTGNFSAGQRVTMNLSTCTPQIAEGMEVWPVVQAIIAGSHEVAGTPTVRSKANGETATYSVDGSLFSWSVNLNR